MINTLNWYENVILISTDCDDVDESSRHEKVVLFDDSERISGELFEYPMDGMGQVITSIDYYSHRKRARSDNAKLYYRDAETFKRHVEEDCSELYVLANN